MKSNTNSNLKSFFLVLLLSTTLIGVFILIQSKPAKNLGLDILFDVLSKIVLMGSLLYILKQIWGDRRTGPKILLVLFITLIAIFTTSEIIENWPRLPWLRANAFSTVDAFMTDLNENDYDTVMTRFTPRMQRCINPTDLRQPGAQPVSWELNSMDENSNIQGMAIFADGQELSLTVRMVWSEGNWLINGFWFGTWDEGKLDYSSMNCGE